MRAIIVMKPISKTRKAVYKVVILFIVAVAAYSNAIKELNRLQELVGRVQQFTSAGRKGLARVYAATKSPDESRESIHPSHDSNKPSTCELGKGGHTNVADTDVRLKLLVNGPTGIELLRRAANGEISASTLSGSVGADRMDRSLEEATRSYARARTVKGQTFGKPGNANWPRAIEFKLADRAIALDLPSITSSEIGTDTFQELRKHVSRELEMAAEN